MNSRNQSLDVLRGVAILLVLGRHINYYAYWHMAGWIGVDLFFVLSGFLISGLLFSEYQRQGNINVARFLLRRGLKIWPSFYAFMLAIGLFAIINGLPPKLLAFELFLASLFLQNYFGGPAITSHVWSLCVEEHFYLLLPFAILGLVRWRNHLTAIPWIGAILLPLCLGLRILAGLPTGQVFSQTHLRIDSLFCGVTLGYFFHFKPEIFSALSKTHWLPVTALCCLPPFLFEERSHVMQWEGLSLLAVGFSLLVAWAVPRKPIKALQSIAAIGKYSYSIYVWHLPIAVALSGHSFFSFWAALFVSIVVGVASAKLIEFPVLRLRERLLPDQPVKSQPILSVKVALNRGDLCRTEEPLVDNYLRD